MSSDINYQFGSTTTTSKDGEPVLHVSFLIQTSDGKFVDKIYNMSMDIQKEIVLYEKGLTS